MATYTVTDSRYNTVKATFTYSVSSTTTETTVTVSSVTVEKPPNTAFSFTIGVSYVGSSSYEFTTNDGISPNTGGKVITINHTKTYSRGQSASSKNVYFLFKIGDISNKGNTSVTVPALPTYTNTYYPNGGSGSGQTQTHQHGSAFTTKTTSTFSRTNYMLSKWNTAANGSGTNYAANTSYTVNSNLSLYAQWTQVYASPQVTITKAYRCDSTGAASDEGTYAAIEYNVSIWNTSTTNSCTVVAVVDDGSVSPPSATSSQFTATGNNGGRSSFNSNKLVVNASMAADNSYPVNVTVTDTQGGGTGRSSATETKAGTIGTAFYTIDVLEGGHGIAFGMPAKSEGFYVGMPFHAHTLSNPNDVNNSKAGIIHQSLDFSSTASVSTNTRITSTSDRDMNGLEVGYSEIFKTPIPSVYRSFAVKNQTSGLVSAIYLHSLDNGTRYITSIVPNRLLWSGAIWPTSTQTATLAANVTDQLSGIVLCWSAYNSSGAQNYDWNYTFIPKYHVATHNTTGVSEVCVSSKFGAIGTKYVYVHNDKIVGNDGNDDTGTANGITFRNNYWALRYVIGV